MKWSKSHLKLYSTVPLKGQDAVRFPRGKYFKKGLCLYTHNHTMKKYIFFPSAISKSMSALS